MGEKNLWSKVGLIVLLVGLSLWQMFPLSERLKPGIDLAGGSSLLFEIDDTGLQASEKQNLAERVASILKERVDPQGTRNLVWRPIGQNRLEIQMPRPPGQQKTQREAFENSREAIQASNVTESQVRSILTLPPDQRQAAIAEMSKVVKSRKALLDQLVEANDKYEKLKSSTTQPEGAVAEQMDKLFLERSKLVDDILQTNLDPRVLTDLLELGKSNEARKSGLTKLKEKHPDLAAQIDTMTSAYDDWSKVKAALDDTSDLMRLLRGAGVLEFRILAERNRSNPDMLDSSNPQYNNEPIGKYVDQLQKFGPRPRPNDKYRWFKIAKNQSGKDFPRSMYIVETYAGNDYVLAHASRDMTLTQDDKWTLKSASMGRDQMGRIAINFSLATHGKFGKMTQDNIERPLCIFLDEEAISAANIKSQIVDRGEITGNFTTQYVQYVVNTLEAGALPARLKEVPLQEKTVGPSLGDTNRRMGLKASLLSFIAVAVFMALYYAYNGLVADIALMMNLVITLGIMSFLQATFTLPGIAGLILTLGMAVDANVLIFERMREELQRGVSARMAVKLGYEKAFSAIFDGHVTALITAVILYWIGSEEIKGFGLTLGIGLALSLFTALFVTKQYYNVMVPTNLNAIETRKTWMLTVILALAGGFFMAMGWLLHHNSGLAESTAFGFGKFLMILFGTAAFLVGSMWAFRYVYRISGHQKANRLPMMKLFSAPNFDWMGKYKWYWGISSCTILSGLILMYVGLKDSNLLDIEFVGGTSVQVQLKDGQTLTDEQVRELIADNRKLESAASWLNTTAGDLDKATVKAAGDSKFEVIVPGKETSTQLKALLMTTLEPFLVKNGVTPGDGGVIVEFNRENKAAAAMTATEVGQKVKDAARYAREASNKLGGSRVQLVMEKTTGGKERRSFEIVTTETSRPLVTESILASMGNVLEIKRPVEATFVRDDKAKDGAYPISQDANSLSDVIGGNSQEPVGKVRGGAVIVFDKIEPPQTLDAIRQRIGDTRVQTDFEGIGSRARQVIGLTPAAGSTATGSNALYSKVAIIVAEPNIPYYDDAAKWTSEVANKELALAQAALSSTQSLQRVTQFAPQVANEASQKAIIAVILSLLAIAGYLWVRFGSVEFGAAGILALYHDVAIALACVVASHYVYDTWFGRMLGLRDFKIDLNIIAALLTIVGYSINDSIVIFDRIREIRGRMATLSPRLLNDAVNQTLSRTILTVWTVFMTVVIMYIWGGEGIKGFAFTMIIGCITGSYSTFAIAVPMVQHPRVMWMVTIVISALTAIGLIDMAIANHAVKLVMCLIVAGLAVVLAVRYLASTRAAALPTRTRGPSAGLPVAQS